MTSVDTVKAELDDETPTVQIRSENKMRYKSWRKKYRKMRLGFEDLMEDANQLFIAEHKARTTARRIQEEIDQIVEILMELNEDPKTPAHLRWNLDRPSTQTDTTLTYGKSLADFEKRVTHTLPSLPKNDVLPSDLVELDDDDGRPPPGYMTIEHEEEYLTVLDIALAAVPPFENLPPNADAVHMNPVLQVLRSSSKMLPTDRDFALQCPISVHNWLKRNQPQVFDQQKEKADSDKGEVEAKPRQVGGRPKKEKAAPSRHDLSYDGLDDEVGFDAVSDVPGSGSGRGKKKRDDDAYRPKGGHSKAQKRKREKEDVIEGKGKKLRKSGLSMAEDA